MHRWILGLVMGVALSAPCAAGAQGTRTVTYDDHAIIPVATKVRFTTGIILPPGERILDFVCGDKDSWVVSGADNLTYVKPAKPGASTNLNLIAASGAVYSFVLSEGTGDPDLKLYVMVDAATAPTAPTLFTRAEFDALKREAEAARQAAEATQQRAERASEEAIRAFRARYPVHLRFPYQFRASQPPFYVRAIYHDDHFTYIHANSPELPALYELRDGAPNLIPFQVEEGVYVVPKVLGSGYLAI